MVCSTMALVTGLKEGSHPPHRRHVHENLWLEAPAAACLISWITIGVFVVGSHAARSRRTPHRCRSAFTLTDAESPFIRAIGYASHPCQARIDRTFPQVPPAQAWIRASGLGLTTKSRATNPVPSTYGRLTGIVDQTSLISAGRFSEYASPSSQRCTSLASWAGRLSTSLMSYASASK